MKMITIAFMAVLILPVQSQAFCEMQGFDRRAECLKKVQIKLKQQEIKELKKQTILMEKILKRIQKLEKWWKLKQTKEQKEINLHL